MKAGTIVRLPDGREGTVVYHGLDGYGIRWGRTAINYEAIMQGDGNTMAFIGGNAKAAPQEFQDFPEAMLREPYPSADLPCVGEEFEIVEGM